MSNRKAKSKLPPAGNDYVAQPSARSSVFSREECNRIIQLSERFSQSEGMVTNHATGPDPRIVLDTRDSRIRRIGRTPESKWLFEKLQAIADSANKYYKFKLSGVTETLQVATYTNGGFYDWHIDIGANRASTRKLSASVQLAESSDYDGGDLEFMSFDARQMPKDIGTVVIFPSFLTHRVAPVTRGTRKSLVLWFHGPSFQ